MKEGNFWIDTPSGYVELERESRKFYLHPWLRSYIADIRPTTILDFGSGDGSLFDEFDMTNVEVVMYDHSERMIEMAKRRFGKNSRIKYLTDARVLPLESFDVVVCSLVLMTVPTEDELLNVIGKMHRVLKARGRCIVAITHPCFRQYPFSTFTTEFTEKPFFYMKNGHPFRVTLSDPDTHRCVEFTDYHWSLSMTLNLFASCGFSLEHTEELPDQAAVEHIKNEHFPGYIVFDFFKTP